MTRTRDAFGRRIAAARKNLDLTQEQMAERLGVSRAHYARIETGASRPSFEVLEKLQRALGVGLLNGMTTPVTTSTTPQVPTHQRSIFEVFDWTTGQVEVPLYAEIAAGEPIVMDCGEEGIMVPEEWAPNAESGEVLVRVRGQSMIEHGLEDGDYLVVALRENGVVATGELVVAWLNGGCTVKYWVRRGGKKILQSGNPDYPSHEVTPDDDMKVLGVVRRSLRPRVHPRISG